MTSATDPLIGATLGDAYEVRARVGEGAMGTVYRGIQLAVGRDVAIKVLRTGWTGVERRKAAVARFRREALATSRLTHPNTVRLIDFGETDRGLLYLILELLEGESLADVLVREGTLDTARVASIGRQIAKSLAEAHALEIVHRDLKPENIFLIARRGDPDFVKVMDFGVARLLGDVTLRATGERTALGTPIYMSPEQADGHDVTPASDLYSLGVLLHELLMGRPPFDGDSYLEIALQHVHTTPPRLSLHEDVLPAVTDVWQQLLDLLLAKAPEDRPPSAAVVADELAVIEDLERDARRAVESGERPAWAVTGITGVDRPSESADDAPDEPTGRRHVWLWAVLGAAIAAAVLLALTLGGDPSPPSPAPDRQPDNHGATPPATPPDRPAPAPAADVQRLDTPIAALEPPADGGPSAPDVAAADIAQPTRLKLDSTPGGADVRRAGETICVTPCDLEVPFGTTPETLVLSRRGYQGTRLEVTLAPGATVEREVVLTRHRRTEPQTPKTKAPLPSFRQDDPSRTDRH